MRQSMKRKIKNHLWVLLFIIPLGMLLAASIIIVYQRVILETNSSFDKYIIIDLMGNGELYDLLHNAVRSSNGDLSPLANMLELMGIVSFTLIAVNEVQSKRSFGILMEDVIDYYFPLHLFIQVGFYTCFALLGGYACGKGIGMVGTLCGLGLLICFGYSIRMAWKLLLSPKAKNRSVLKYIDRTIRQQSKLNNKIIESNAKKGKKCFICIEGWREKIERYREKRIIHVKTKQQQQLQVTGKTILDFAEYVGIQWEEKASLQIYGYEGESIEQELIDWIKIWLFLPGFEANTESNVSIGKSFTNFFPVEENSADNIAEFVLYTKCLPFYQDEIIVSFYQNIQRCRKLWDCLFHNINDKKKRAQLAHKLLKSTYCKCNVQDQELFTLLALSLLTYLGFTHDTDTELKIKDQRERSMGFLLNLCQIDAEIIPEEQLDTVSFLDGCAEIVVLALVFLKWESLLSLPYNKQSFYAGPEIQKKIAAMIFNFSLKERFPELDKYIVFTWILLLLENKDEYGNLSVYELRRLMLEMHEQMQLELYNH